MQQRYLPYQPAAAAAATAALFAFHMCVYAVYAGSCGDHHIAFIYIRSLASFCLSLSIEYMHACSMLCTGYRLYIRSLYRYLSIERCCMLRSIEEIATRYTQVWAACNENCCCCFTSVLCKKRTHRRQILWHSKCSEWCKARHNTHTQHTEHSVLCVSVGPVPWIWSRSCMKRKWAVPFRCNSFISTRNRIFWHRDGEIFVVLVSDASGTPSMLDILDHWLCLFVWCIEFLFSSKNKQRPAKIFANYRSIPMFQLRKEHVLYCHTYKEYMGTSN